MLFLRRGKRPNGFGTFHPTRLGCFHRPSILTPHMQTVGEVQCAPFRAWAIAAFFASQFVDGSPSLISSICEENSHAHHRTRTRQHASPRDRRRATHKHTKVHKNVAHTLGIHRFLFYLISFNLGVSVLDVASGCGVGL